MDYPQNGILLPCVSEADQSKHGFFHSSPCHVFQVLFQGSDSAQYPFQESDRNFASGIPCSAAGNQSPDADYSNLPHGTWKAVRDIVPLHMSVPDDFQKSPSVHAEDAHSTWHEIQKEALFQMYFPFTLENAKL